MLLRNDPNGDGSKGVSTLEAGLVDREISDLERYLDSTRAEILFARGVILVEGASEMFLVPAVAENMDKALDEYGITVCSVHGTDFVPYAKLIGPSGLNIPFVILTDGDWYKPRNGDEVSLGLRRAVRVAQAIGHTDSAKLSDMFRLRQWDEMNEAANEMGIFVGSRTLEVDLFDSQHGPELVDALVELGASKATAEALQGLANLDRELNEDEAETLLKSIERIGKGRVAQRLAGKIDADRFPTYIKDGVLQLVEVLSK